MRTTRPLTPLSGELLARINNTAKQPAQTFPTLEDPTTLYPPGHPAYRGAQPRSKHPGERQASGASMPHKLPDTPRLNPLAEEVALPGCFAIFKARAQASTSQTIQAMGRRERVNFILLDGRRTIQDIARLTHHTEREVAQIMVHLTKIGYTEYISG